MNKLKERIRRNIALRRKSRRMTTTLTAIAGILAFLTVYTLILPALALEEDAYCGMEAHEHSDDCYEQALTCKKEEHEHTDDCYDEDGNLVCDKIEHTHADKCYKKTLTCGKEQHIHTKSCYKKPEPEEVTKGSAEIQEEVTSASGVPKKEKDNDSGSDGTTSRKDDDKTASKDKKETAKTDKAESDSSSAKDAQTLEELDLSGLFTEKTGLWYQDKPAGDDSDWKQVKKDTLLEREDLVRIHLAFQLPKDSLNGYAYESVYILPANISITQETADWLNDDANAVNQVITGQATPGKASVVKEYLAGNYELVQNEDGKWQLVITWDPYVITENAKNTINIWTELYVTGKSLPAAKNGSHKIIFAGKTKNHKEIAVEFAGIKDTKTKDTTKKESEDTANKASGKTAKKSDSDAAKAEESGNSSKGASASESQKNSDNSGNDSTPANDASKDNGKTQTLTYTGSDYTVAVAFGKDAKLPEDVRLDVREIREDSSDKAEKKEFQSYYKQAESAMKEKGASVTAARFFDITFVSGQKEVEPAAPVSVKIEYKKAEAIGSDTEVAAVHMPKKAGSEILDTEVNTDKKGVKEIEFTAESFSVYGIVYTVDFEYEVDGKMYDFSLPGGSFVTLQQLVEVLGIIEDTYEGENEGNSEELNSENSLTLSGVEVSEATKKFVAGVESVEFSSPELVWVGKVDEETTVGALKETNGLEVQYSAELTEEQIEDINAQTVDAGDWALISMLPFLSEESLTVTMKTGEVFTIKVTDAQISKTVIDEKGDTWEITVIYGEDAQIPDGAELKVTEILPEDEEYQKYNHKTQQAIYGEEDSDEPVADLIEEAGNTTSEEKNDSVVPSEEDYARIFDIEIWNGEEKIEPAAEVRVDIKLQDAPEGAAPNVVHFAEDGPKVMEISDEGEETGISFMTDGFSVYSVLYTVDFEFEVNGKVYAFSMNGEDAISLRALLQALHVYEKMEADESEDKSEEENNNDVPIEASVTSDTLSEQDEETSIPSLDKLMDSIESVEFSNEELLKVCKVENDTTLGELNVENKIVQEFTLYKLQAEVEKRNSKEFKEGDWALVSLQPFDTEETLTIALTTGETFTIKVTDAQIPALNEDGTVQTIANPAGTTIDLFDYWIDDSLKDTTGRAAWPGGWNGNGWDRTTTSTTGATLLGTGNNAGINAGHMLKFSPAWSETVQNGTLGTATVDGQYRINSWTGQGSTRNGTPTQGIVASALDSNGYPVLSGDSTIGADTESLQYLFDPSYSHSGKASYAGVNHLFYVDADGYYTFQSNDYNASFNSSTNEFTLSDHTASARPERGFWPFGQENYWVGMHMKSEFSMPANGKVLNPQGVYMPMTFEFAGDDDAWVYLDGILIGDGGGIHNITRISIDFSTGKVLVYDDENNKTVTSTTLKALYTAAGIADKYSWNGDTYADFTYHTFDFFYLERGGGESNLYIKYNLVSTYDFTGHKSYENNPNEVMLRDQFQFEMIGLDGAYDTSGNLKDSSKKAIMPVPSVSDSSAEEGTVAHPTLVYNETNKWQVYTTGVSEDGNINFGSANISSEEIAAVSEGSPNVYRYIVREVIPEDAVNSDGVKYSDATEEQKSQGGFVLNEVQYDNKVYYMTTQVTSWKDSNGTTQYGLSKRYYTDDTYTTSASDSFISFTNKYSPDSGSVSFTKTDASNNPLAGATFTLYTDEACTDIAQDLEGDDLVVTSGSDGIVSFENVDTGVYYMKETDVPSGYAANDTVYKVTIEDSKDTTKYSKIIMNGDESETAITKIVNTKPGEISVVKEWLDESGNVVSGGGREARVKIQRKKWEGGSSDSGYTVNFTIKIQGSTEYIYTYTENNVLGSTVTIDWWDTNTIINDFSVTNSSGSSMTYQRSDYWDGDNHKNRKVVISNVSTDVNVIVTYPSSVAWLFGSEHTSWMKDVSVVGSGGTYVQGILVEDTSFNTSIDSSHFATLSSPAWSNTWTIGGTESSYADYDFPASEGTNEYRYYVVEVDDDGNALTVNEETELGYTLSGYLNNSGITQGVITVYNKVDAPETIDIIVKKTDNAENSTNYLEGAIFKLEYKATAEATTWTNVSNETVPELDSDSQFTVPREGITLTGLADGVYRLHEIISPTGYVITESYPVVFTVSGGAITSTDGTIENVRYTAASGTADATFIVPNTPGVALPSTGGIGTTPFRTLGATLVTLVSLLYGFITFRKRRKLAIVNETLRDADRLSGKHWRGGGGLL